VTDVLDAADYLASRAAVDSARLGSWAGAARMIVLLAIERSPKKFRAAVEVVGITDLVAYMSYKPEYRRQDVAKNPGSAACLSRTCRRTWTPRPWPTWTRSKSPLLILATTFDRTVPVQLHTERLHRRAEGPGKDFEPRSTTGARRPRFSQGDSEPSRDSRIGFSPFWRNTSNRKAEDGEFEHLLVDNHKMFGSQFMKMDHP